MKTGNLNHLHLKLAFLVVIMFSSSTFSADKEMNKMCHKEIMEKCEKGMSMDKCKDLMNNMKK